MDFEPGDIVQLRSGGPAMTVKEIGKMPYRDDPGVWCIWFEQVGPRNEIKEQAFMPITLKKIENSSGNLRSVRA